VRLRLPRHAIPAAFLDAQGWRTGTHGEFLTKKGRTVIKVGFTRATRRCSANANRVRSQLNTPFCRAAGRASLPVALHAPRGDLQQPPRCLE